MAEKKTEKTTEQTAEVSAVKEEIARMLDEARAEAGRIVEDARKKVRRNSSAERESAIAADLTRGEELVEVKLFKDSDKYKDDVFVGCNGENVVIQRGVKVKIKRKFAEILEHSELQDFETTELIKSMMEASES